MVKRILSLFGAAGLCLALAGCSFTGLDAKNLMSPPKANADQQAIHKLLQGNRPDVSFVYPKSGEYRSAVIMRDFTGDGQQDAIGFCSLEEPAGVEVRFLTKMEGEWKSVASFRSTAIQVDRVCFGDLTGSGTDDVLIGWGSAAGATGRTAAVNAYHYSSGGVSEYSLGIYGEMALTDLDGDGVCEVFTADKFVPAEAEGDEPTPAKARVYAWQDGGMKEAYAVEADNSISSYSAAVFGELAPGLPAVLLDGAKADGSMTTQVFTLSGGVLKNLPSGVNSEAYQNPFERPSAASFLCRDLNGDGYLELPAASLLPGLSPETVLDTTSFLVTWYAFEPQKGVSPVVRALMNLTENYWFRLPYELAGHITAVNDSGLRAVTYAEVVQGEDGAPLLGEPLFTIRAFSRSAWESLGETSGYEQLTSQGDTVYGVQALTADEKKLGLLTRVKRDFKLLGE